MALHSLSCLDDDQSRSLLTYYREQEAAGNVTIKSSDFRRGELLVVNYTDQFNESTAPSQWGWRMEAARGCVLFKEPGTAPEVVVKAMQKFHGYWHCPEAQRHLEADGPLTLMQKFDGSCISMTCFRGEVLIFTRGARHSQQTQLARSLMSEEAMGAMEEMEGRTFAFELIHELDTKCEENRGPNRLVLLYACDASGHIIPVMDLPTIARSLQVECVGCEAVTGSEVMRRIKALDGVTSLDDLREGFVVEVSAQKYKVKAPIYQQLARSKVPRPTQAWLDKCFLHAKSFADVRDDVEKMQNDAPLNYGILATDLLNHHLARVDEEVRRLRSLHASFPSPRELSQSDAVTKADKGLLFPCVRLPVDERDTWFDTDTCRLRVTQSLAAKFAEQPSQRRGFPVASGRLVLCGAPGKKSVQQWADGIDCVVTLLRADELAQRGLALAAVLPPLGVEWQHLPISGASLLGREDRSTVQGAAGSLAERLRAGETVLVHCSAGLHRTGIVGYLALRRLGHSMASAFELLGQVRWETRAELERIHFRNESSEPDAPSRLIAVAEELVLEAGARDPAGPDTSS